jgi:signal transduction histidine kinase
MQSAIHVLLLEDDPGAATAIWEELRRGGLLFVPRAAAGRDAFAAELREFRPELVLADANDRGDLSLELLELSRELSPETPHVVIGAEDGRDWALRCVERGAAAYVLKDRLWQLVPTVVRAVREAEERKQRRRAEVLLEIRYHQLALQNEALRRSQTQVLEISDREQSRLGRDLHDGLCQLLVSVAFNARTLAQELARQSSPEVALAERIGARISEAIKTARHLAQGLCPVNFETEDLASALERLARNTREDYNIPCEAESCSGKLGLDPAAAIHLYRIAQEAVHNAVKHASPSRISVRLFQDAHALTLSVADDGPGIPETAAITPGMGLELMKYRASLLHGNLEVRRLRPTEGRGTLVSCTVPAQASNSPSL